MGPTNEHLYTSEEMRDITCVSLSARGMEGGFASHEGWSSAIFNGRAERRVKRVKVRGMSEVAEHMYT
jgi:hypothetical protein